MKETFEEKLGNTLDWLYYQAKKGDEYHGRTESVKTAKQTILDLIDREIIGKDDFDVDDRGYFMNELREKQHRVLRGEE